MNRAAPIIAACAAFALYARAAAALPEGWDSIRDEEPSITLRPASGVVDIGLSPRAAIQVRGTLPFDDGPRSTTAGDLALAPSLLLRRVRVGLDASILPTITASIATDLVDEVTPAATQTPLVVGFVNLDLRLTQLSAGFMRVPFTRHGLVDETRQVFVESPSAWRADRFQLGRGKVPSILPDRRVGVQLHEEIEGYGFAFGVFSGGGEGATERASSAIFAGRIEAGPWGAVPLEGAYFEGDYEYDEPRASLSLGGLGRTGANGTTRAVSGALAMSYKGLFASFEAAFGNGRVDGIPDRTEQRGLVLDVAYRFPVVAQGLEVGVRADGWHTDPALGAGADQRSVAGVANLYVWRHRVKASALVRVTRRDDAAPDAGTPAPTRTLADGLLELTVGF